MDPSINPPITYRSIKFQEKIVEYKDLKIFRPLILRASYWFLLKKYFNYLFFSLQGGLGMVGIILALWPSPPDPSMMIR